jgi:hypothetical protein
MAMEQSVAEALMALSAAENRRVKRKADDMAMEQSVAEALMARAAQNRRGRNVDANRIRCREYRQRLKKALQDSAMEKQTLDFQNNGYIFMTPAKPCSINALKAVVEASLSDTTTQISGNYSQTHLGDIESLSRTTVMLEVLQVAERIFTRSLGQEVEVEIYQAALLVSSPLCYPPKAQLMHADNIGFISLVCIIMLSEDGGDSTHIISSRHHGAETPIPRRDYLQFTYAKRKKFRAIQKAVKQRYGSLLSLEPGELYGGKCEPKRLGYGAIEIFRSDILHAGPVANMQRKVLFTELRVKGEIGPKDTNYQFRIPELMTISNYSRKEIKKAAKVWKNQA